MNPASIVDWRDVIELIYTPPSIAQSHKTVCPICLEAAEQMVAPRITKCGHIFCWPCLLQYLNYERANAWKKCPLCADPVYKRDIRRASLNPL